VVEGGTLLRCYTSQRGIEGSNPSSSAQEAPCLQEYRGDKVKGRDLSRPSLHQRSQKTNKGMRKGRGIEAHDACRQAHHRSKKKL
jgi:hypothetical protein